MIPLNLERLTFMAEGLLLQGDPNAVIRSVHFDSRQLDEDSLFVAVKGDARDGHDYLLDAAAKGAKAALISDQTRIPPDLPRDFALILVNDTVRGFQKLAAAYRRNFSFPFIAVTGSNGKTTTKDIIAHLLGSKHKVYRTFKNFNNHLGVPYSLLQIEPGQEAAVLEVGMNHAGEIDRLADLFKPQISVITHIGDAHIEYFGTREKIALAKAELLPHTAPDGLVLLNGDNEYLHKISHLYSGDVWFYSIEGPADIWAEGITSDEQGTHFTVHFRSGEHFPVFLPLFGRHNVANALPAIAIARRFGFSTEEIQSGLREVSISAMRFQLIHTSAHGLFINDAYNASPSSMKAAIETFADIVPQRKKVLVLADMFELGTDSARLHAEVGTHLNAYPQVFEQLVTIGNDSRYISDAYEGSKVHFPAKDEALPYLRQFNSKQYAILFKASRGMRLETLIEALKEDAE